MLVSIVVVPAVDVDVNPIKLAIAPGAVVEFVPPLAIGKVPVTPVVSGKPVPFVSVTD